MKNNSWFNNEKEGFFKSEKSSLFKDKPKLKPKKKCKDDFTPERAVKLAGGLALVGVGTAVAVNLIGDM